MKKIAKVVVAVTMLFMCYTVPTWAYGKVGGRYGHTSPPDQKNSATTKDTESKVSDLVADGFTIIEKISAEKKASELALKRAEKQEMLEYPSIDLYGENSWGRFVNPYAGVGEKPNVPESYDIDCDGFVCPLDGDLRITSHYGYRARFRRQHKGIDLGLRYGDTIRAAFDGKVRIADYEGRGYGHYVVIRHSNGLETVYGHMSRRIAKENDIVHAGDPIGLGGSTGRSTGPHLHFETRFMGIDINPEHIIDFHRGTPIKDVYTFKRNGRNAFAYDHSYAAKNGAKYKYSSSNGKRSTPRVYRIRKGDSLSTIAKRNGTTVSKLCKLNGISSKAVLRPGKSLRVN